jgi:FkbM family methyltransferase
MYIYIFVILVVLSLLEKLIEAYGLTLYYSITFLIRKSHKTNDPRLFSSEKHGKLIRISRVAEGIFSTLVLPVPKKYRYNHLINVPYRDSRILIRPFIFSEILMVSGVWEPYVQYILDSEIKETDVLVDVGANIGIYALAYSKKVKKIIAFEPHPKCVEMIRKSIKLNKVSNIELIEKAVGDSRSRVKLGLSVVPMTSGILMHDKVESSIEADMIDLDTELLTKEKIDWILIDVEGFEVNVLNGAKSILSKHSPRIIVESNDDRIQEVKGILKEKGYNISQLYSIYYYAFKSVESKSSRVE